MRSLSVVVLLPYRIRAASQLGRLAGLRPCSFRASRALAASAGRVRDVAVRVVLGVIEGIPIDGFIPNTPNEDAAAVYEFAGGRLDQSARHDCPCCTRIGTFGCEATERRTRRRIDADARTVSRIHR